MVLKRVDLRNRWINEVHRGGTVVTFGRTDPDSLCLLGTGRLLDLVWYYY